MFQFQCPNGHILEGDESQAGQRCQCPMCNMLFIIPQPLGSAPSEPAVPAQGEAFPNFIGPSGGNAGQQDSPQSAPDPMAPVSEAPGPGFQTGGDAAEPESTEPKLYHIPCPNGHELEVPEEMLRQDVICPFCETQFHLRKKDSVEYKKEKEEEQEKKDRKAGKAWLHWSIAIAVVVGLTLLCLIIYDVTN